MNSSQYKKLCKACDNLLNSAQPDLSRVAISWLHVIREHPVFLNKYSSIFIKEAGIEGLSQTNLFITLRNIILALRHLIKSTVIFPRRLIFSPGLNIRDVDFLFFSHLTNISQLEHSKEDFYYGHLPDFLANNGYRVLVVFLNHTSEADSLLKSKLRSDIEKVILPSYFGFFNEFKIFFNQCFEYIRLTKLLKKSSSMFDSDVIKRSRSEVFSGATRLNLLIGKHTEELVKIFKPNYLVTTYEGHAWERVVYYSARIIDKNIVCMGYQHSAFFRMQHSMLRSIGKFFDPNIILTSGELSHKLLSRKKQLKKIDFCLIGSPKNKSEKLFCSNSHKNVIKKVCLVLPEGVLSECEILFRFSIECARVCGDVQFIWRLHPLMSFEGLKKKFNFLSDLPINIKVSTSSLEDDLSKSKWALYRGSTAIFDAIQYNIGAIYLDLPNEMSINPLWAFTKVNKKVSDVSEIRKIFNSTYPTNKKCLDARKLSSQLFSLPDYMDFLLKIKKRVDRTYDS